MSLVTGTTQVDPTSAQGRQLQQARRLPVPTSSTSGEQVPEHVQLTAIDLLTPDVAQGYPAELSAWDSTRTEQFLSRGHFALAGIGLGAAALLLRPVLTSIAAARPFGAGNARRLAQLALLTVLIAHLAPLLPALAADQVLERLGLDGADSPLSVAAWLHLGAWDLIAVVVLVLAEAFRQGERLHRDLDGLV
ncbi:DUF2975 domain-containing protein [Paenibacillus sp. TRM 82003]|uniref:DUF2975 domain-containing protein n=1 Tax=Kineococcus sp. TRM81007 TaxID=2925831 RepID=UPI001F5716FE|nr:DUF2975 domain-containing protein [Kineococcus sp. TRM81007]MCI2237780.1 DUF2975 domain-containing protein [Kineococcus sp. TRM81007]MCI3921799.1 DUF2975 domain-containing protein [Paenibacillus sp. TRM 82003]